MTNVKHHRIAVLWRGDREVREAATPQNNRYHRILRIATLFSAKVNAPRAA